MGPRFRCANRLTLCAAATLAITGCSMMNPTPITRLPEADREVVSQSPEEVRLKKPATVAGFPLAAGSVVKNDDGRGYLIETAEQTTHRGVTIPAGSSVEIKYKDDDWKWNGVVHVGGSFTYGLIPAEKGDTLYFTASEYSTPTMTEVRIKTARTINGKSLPEDSVIDLERDGKIKATYTPEQQKSCRETCAPFTNSSANWKCRASCGGL